MKKDSAMSPLSIPTATWGDGKSVTFVDYATAAEEALQEGRLDAAARFLELAYFLGDKLNVIDPPTCRRDRIRRDRIH
jgi:hypothetical protein